MNFERLYKSELSIALNNASTTVLFTSTVRQQAVNDAQEEFADLTECVIRQKDITCSCNTTEYMLLSSGVLSGSTDYVRLAKQGVEYLFTDSNGRVTQLAGPDDFPERPVQWRHAHAPGWRASTSPVQTPSGYYLRPDGGNLYIGLNEPPDLGSSETGVLRVPYVALPAPMASSGAEPFTVNSSVRTDLRIYHRALPHYAAFKLLPLIGDQVGADAHLQQFLGYVARYTQAQRPRGGQHVRTTRDYYRDSRRRGWTGDASIARDPRWGVRS